MLVDSLELTGGAQRIDFYMNEQLCKKLLSYTNFAFNSTALKNLQMNTTPSQNCRSISYLGKKIGQKQNELHKMTAFSIFRPKFLDLSFSCLFKPSSLPTAVLLFQHSYLKDICSTSHSTISPGVAIHKICCVSSEIFNFKVPQLPGEAVLSDKSCFSYFLNLGQFLKLLVVRIEFLELFSCQGMVWN